MNGNRINHEFEDRGVLTEYGFCTPSQLVSEQEEEEWLRLEALERHRPANNK